MAERQDATSTPNVTPWDETPIVTVFAPACPYCRSEDYHRLKTMDNGDNSRTKRVECRRCQARYCIAIEPLPVSGNWTIWPDRIPA